MVEPLAAAARYDGRDVCKSNDQGEWLEMDAHTQGSRSAKRPVIYCYDGSEPSRHALEMGSATLGEAQAVVVCVWRSIWNTTAGLAYGVLPQDAVDAAETAAHQAAAAMAEQGAALVDISTAVALRSDDSIWERILEYADSCDAGVIRRRLSRFERDQVGGAGKRVARAGQQQPTPGTGGLADCSRNRLTSSCHKATPRIP